MLIINIDDYTALNDNVITQAVLDAAIAPKAPYPSGPNDPINIHKAELDAATSIQLFFPAGVYEFPNELSISPTKPFELLGESGTIFKCTAPININRIIAIGGVKNNLKVKNIVFDGDNKASNLFLIQNKVTTLTEEEGLVSIENCSFINAFGKDSPSSPLAKASGLFVQGPYESVSITNCLFDNISSPGIKGNAVASGIICKVPTKETININGVDVKFIYEGYPRQVVISNSQFYNITDKDTTVDSDGKGDSDGIKAIAPPNDSFDSSILVTGCTFRNCKKRSIKSQYENTIVTNCIFKRDDGEEFADGYKYTEIYGGHVEVDFQYGGGTLSNCIFNYDTNAPTRACGYTSRENYSRGMNISNNIFSYKGIKDTLDVIVAGATAMLIYENKVVIGPDGQPEKNPDGTDKTEKELVASSVNNHIGDFIVSGNKVNGEINYFADLRLGQNDLNNCIIKNNMIDKVIDKLDNTPGAFVNVWSVSGIAATLRGTFVGNRANVGTTAFLLSNSSKLSTNKWDNNQNLINTSLSDAFDIQYIGSSGVSINSNTQYKKVVITGMAYGNAETIIPLKIAHWSSSVKISAIFTYAGSDTPRQSLLETYVSRNTSSLIINQDVIRLDSQQLGKWELVAVDSETLNLIKRGDGSYTNYRPFWVTIEGNNIKM